ncbi:MAG TPA: hypothetical protein VGT60_12720 [Candidatus Limnocylindria bacterium]|nr:hypothetical protein [Candidatus Limnocylindria bacterium]
MRSETDALAAVGFYFLVPVSSPGNHSGTYAQGGAAAQAATTDIQTAINAGRVDLPPTSNHAVYLHLDVESVSLSADYWNGWWDACRASFITSPKYGTWQPIYSGAYASPNDAATMNVLTAAAATRPCYGLWTTYPSARDCTYCAAPGPDWSNAVGHSGLTLTMWQYGIHELAGFPNSGCPYSNPGPACSSPYPNVDLDQSSPLFTQTDYMLWIT